MSGTKIYTVRPGDTLAKIAQANGYTNYSILCVINKIKDPNVIKVG
jgi:LysM repeat protein